jgi:hypothetical protein
MRVDVAAQLAPLFRTHAAARFFLPLGPMRALRPGGFTYRRAHAFVRWCGAPVRTCHAWPRAWLLGSSGPGGAERAKRQNGCHQAIHEDSFNSLIHALRRALDHNPALLNYTITLTQSA